MKQRTWMLFLAGTAVAAAIVGSALLTGCSGAPTSPTPTSGTAVVPPTAPTAATTPPSQPATPAVSGLELGKMIFTTGNDNAGAIAVTGGIAKIKVNACKNCHGVDAKGGKPLPGPDIRGSKLQPDFDQTKFARAVTTGVDDTGKRLHKQMPRFSATPEDTDALWMYLNTLK